MEALPVRPVVSSWSIAPASAKWELACFYGGFAMSNPLDVDNLGLAATVTDRLKRREPAGAMQTLQTPKDREPRRSPEVRPKSENAISLSSVDMSRLINREGTKDLRTHCPVCGHPYQPGEGVLAMACLSFAFSAAPAAPDHPSSTISLGHYGCVLPRLLTLLASFRPAARFEKAFLNFSDGEPAFAESHHDKP